jgi:hypothetical protein
VNGAARDEGNSREGGEYRGGARAMRRAAWTIKALIAAI